MGFEKPVEIGTGDFANLLRAHVSKRCQLLGNIGHQRRRIGLATKWHRRQIRAVSLNQQAVQRDQRRKVTKVLRGLEGEDA